MDEERKKRELEELIRQLRNGNKDKVVEAVQILRKKNWLFDGTLKDINLSGADLLGSSNLREVGLTAADLSGADLRGANLSRTALGIGTNLSGADLRGANLSKADLRETDLRGANLSEADLRETDLRGVDLSGVELRGVDLSRAKLSGAKLNWAKKSSREDLIWPTQLSSGVLHGVKLRGVDLHETDLRETDLRETDLRDADLRGADLRGVPLIEANLRKANLSKADLSWTDLSGADLRETDLREANLCGATLIRTNLTKSNLSNANIYGISAWNLALDDAIQSDLVITDRDEPVITVDDLEVAQFIYLLLNNQKIRKIIDTITSKSVLILGRFTPERKAVLDAIREELRKHNYTPILFDFENSENRDLTETVMTLAGMARFVIADLSDPNSIGHELMSFGEKLLSVPIQGIFCPTLEHPKAYPMYEHLRRYPHVLPIYQYENQKQLVGVLYEKVIQPAEEKVRALRTG